MAMLAHLGDTIFISSSALLLTSVERVARYRYSVSFEKLGVIETSEQLFLQLVLRLILEDWGLANPGRTCPIVETKESCEKCTF